MGVIEDVTQVKNDQGLADLFQVADWKIFLPFTAIAQPGGSLKKVPSDGQYNLSYTDASCFMTLLDARERVDRWAGLKGVGLMFTGGIVDGDWQLIGLDFDKVKGDLKRFKLPVASYADRSPSGKGIHQLAWVPVAWAARYRYTGGIQLPGCDHAEVYLASGWLTVTGDKLNDLPINRLTDKELLLLESWNLNPYEKPKASAANLDLGDGTPFVLSGRTAEHRQLLAGKIPAGQGKRHPIVMSLLLTLIEQGHALADIKASVLLNDSLAAYFNKHDDPVKFAQEEINRAYVKSDRSKREALASYHEGFKKDKPVTEPTTDPKFPTGVQAFPMEVFDKAPGLVGEIARWILGAVYKPREEFAYAVALSMVACMVGPYCTHSSRNGKLNMYLTLVGGTGTGKTDAIGAGTLLLSFTDAKDCILDFPASEAALRRQLVVTPNLLLKIDEIAHKLDGMKDNTNGSSMGRAILEAYDGERMPPKVYADSKNSLPAVENPFVQILGGTTDKVWDVVKTSHMDDGTLNRFVFVCAPEKPAYLVNEDPQCEVPKALKDKLNTFFRAGRMADLVGDVPGTKFGRHVSYDDDVKQALVKLGKQVHDKQQEEYGNLYSRLELNTKKIASILVIGDGRDVVEMKDYEQAIAFMEWSVANTRYKISGILANNEYEKQTKKFIRQLEKAGGKMTRRLLFKNSGLYLQDAEKVLNSMEAYGIASVYEEENSSNNHTKTTWVELV